MDRWTRCSTVFAVRSTLVGRPASGLAERNSIDAGLPSRTVAGVPVSPVGTGSRRMDGPLRNSSIRHACESPREPRPVPLANGSYTAMPRVNEHPGLCNFITIFTCIKSGTAAFEAGGMRRELRHGRRQDARRTHSSNRATAALFYSSCGRHASSTGLLSSVRPPMRHDGHRRYAAASTRTMNRSPLAPITSWFQGEVPDSPTGMRY